MYVDNNIYEDTEIGSYLKKYCKYRNNIPEADWCTAFLRRYKLSRKLPSSFEKTRKSAASDPEVIYGYFDILEAEMKRFQLQNQPECIWNIDEIYLPIDPSKTKVIAPVGEKSSRVTATSGREATTVVAGISAAGDKLPPFILFKGKKFWSSWKRSKPSPGMQYAFSDSGWMMAEVFAAWFDIFALYITQRPLLLVYDGHSTHLTSTIIKKARAEDITIIKFPPHTTDVLQPLDVCCFKPLKTRWDATIAKWQAANYT
ncbi:MFS-type transporter clz9-like [Portunus trituberculatus]|uniref:MFS-type transporter clz9-like n=1 Tax=Portunus trituberculatus TaxID=210409 RepID=UPI001E1CB6F9|nr:MFS-type transporter clz9-like [Portunus trituberculatus]